MKGFWVQTQSGTFRQVVCLTPRRVPRHDHRTDYALDFPIVSPMTGIGETWRDGKVSMSVILPMKIISSGGRGSQGIILPGTPNPLLTRQ